MSVQTKSMTTASLLLSMALLAGCVMETQPSPQPSPVTDPLGPPLTEDACGANGLQGLVGQPEAALASLTLTAPARVIRPGMAVTMDYRAERLNIELDGRGQIIRITCG